MRHEQYLRTDAGAEQAGVVGDLQGRRADASRLRELDPRPRDRLGCYEATARGSAEPKSGASFTLFADFGNLHRQLDLVEQFPLKAADK